MNRQQTLASIIAWAAGESNVRVIALTGSVARGDVDALSDLDVELYVRDPDSLLECGTWYEQFGDVLVVEALPNPGAAPSRLVYYAGGKVDFMVVDVHKMASVRHSGPVRVLLDKDQIGTELSTTPGPAPKVAPSEFAECVHWFWAAILMEAKAIVRNELWTALMIRDVDAKRQLLRMIEWDHKARYGWEVDTWYAGRHLSEWAEPEILTALPGCFARFDATEIAGAILATTALFRVLAVRTGQALDVPAFDHERLLTETLTILRTPV